VLTSFGVRASAQSTLAGDRIAVTRAAGPIAVDGSLDDPGWQRAVRVDR